MDNLKLKHYEKVKQSLPDTILLNEVCLDNKLCCFFKKPGTLCIFDSNGISNEIEINLQSDIVQIAYLNIWNVIFIATESEMVVVNVEDSKQSKTEHLNAKIIQTLWNPSQTFLVILDEFDVLTGYSLRTSEKEFEKFEFVPCAKGLLTEVPPNSIYVGWGAQNTQFKGSRKHEEVVEEIPQPYRKPIMSWRGNGEMFVINFWKDNRRFLKVFDINIRPLSCSEPYNNLLAATSFKGQGNFIACAAQAGKSNRVVIYEKNCLIRSWFPTVDSLGEIIAIQYHPERHILGVQSENFKECCLNIYMYSNDVWYLKQQLLFSLENEKLLKFHWINDLNTTYCKLNILTTQAMRMYTFQVETYGVFNDLVAVINGSSVLFTNFSQEIIPPPLAKQTLSFERPVNDISFYLTENVYQFHFSDKSTVCYKYHDGNFSKYSGALGIPSKNGMSAFECEIQGVNYQFLLTDHMELMLNDRMIFAKVTSFYLYGNYLLFTQIENEHYLLHTKRFTSEYIHDPTTFSREIEQGARIVCVTSKDARIILAMPRGNLETITCRLIAIDRIDSLLNANRWSEAVNQIRHQRLNWNLLIDLNQRRFINHITEFIEAAGSISLLNNIVSELSLDNCLQTLYKGYIDTLLLPVYTRKKLDILNEIMKSLVQFDPALNLLSIVTLQIQHYSIKNALKSIVQIFRKNQYDVCKRAINQILRYKHAKDVIRFAYTLYNIDFLYLIYSCCSEDPRVFTPELEELKLIDNVIDLRYTMNERAKDYDAATKYLIRSKNKTTTEIGQFIKKHSTQQMAYKNLQPTDTHFVFISKLYADSLGLKSKHNEAGFVLERAGLNEDALFYYKLALNWQKVVSILILLKVEDKDLTLKTVAKDLANNERVDEAVFIYQHYLDDIQSAIETFVDKKMFQKAICLARPHPSIIVNLIQPALIKYREDLFDRMLETGSRFNLHTKRLLQIRRKKYEKLKTNFYHCDVTENGDFDDVNSEYGSIISNRSSVSSNVSKSSSTSSRNIRKLERKKIDLREGGTFEDIALIRQLHLLAADIFSLSQEVVEVSYVLLDQDHFEYNKKLQEISLEVQNDVMEAIPNIWSETFLNAEPTPIPSVMAVIENRHQLDEKFRKPPSNYILNGI
ncbi:hypothetical protein ABEB36_011402 [Hypothenemus hampei]|uniref:Elongator complex protein 1 n=1 Tax=Hypothenemus hampei TaxID=57062 RepID=A0ABD1EFC5_HYPHA